MGILPFDRNNRVFGLPRHPTDASVLPSLKLSSINPAVNSEMLLSTINHAEHTNSGYGSIPAHNIKPTFFVRKSPLPSKSYLDLLRRSLILRTRLLKEKKEGI